MSQLAVLWHLRDLTARMLATAFCYPPKHHWSALRSDGIGAPTNSKHLLMLLLPQLVFRCAFIARAVAALAIKPLSYARVRLQRDTLPSFDHRAFFSLCHLHDLFFFIDTTKKIVWKPRILTRL